MILLLVEIGNVTKAGQEMILRCNKNKRLVLF